MTKPAINIRVFVLSIVLLTCSLISPGIVLAVTPQVAAGFYHTVGLRTDGTVVAAGDNGNGQWWVHGPI